MTTVTFKGNPLSIKGGLPEVGTSIPSFHAVSQDMQEWSSDALKGKVAVICSVPSLDTPVCDTMAQRFNEELAKQGDGVVGVTISMDLPFAQARWCGAKGIKNITVVSDHRDSSFGNAFGVLINDWRLLARAIFVIDAEGVVRHVQLVGEVTEEPDYEGALEAVKGLLAKS